MSTCSDREGKTHALGRELGRGGEGVVFDLPAQPSLVAKLYHQTPDTAKQRKLRLMAEHIDSPLRDYAAWPEDTLHDAQGAVIGFTMQRIEGRHPIHMLYSPAQRRETFPQARFDFLVFVARNIAAAFATLHEHGHVLGDVNQGNVLVGADSRVILIDCDSFQIQVGEELHRCPVGVAHFTPPELQSIASFEDITRTPNHDAFGLALLIFHLLMGGRHPYSGVPLADHIGESLEADIRDFRYAYASDAAKRLIAPPPKSVPIESLPAEIIELFEQAFTERGVDARPTAAQWLAALDALRQQLKSCARQPLHLYSSHLADCPWCSLDRRHVLLFGELSRPASKVEPKLGIDLAAMEAEMARLKLPEPFEVPSLAPLPVPGGDPDPWLPSPISAIGLGLIGLGVLCLVVLRQEIGLILFMAGAAMMGGLRKSSGFHMSVVDYCYAYDQYQKIERRLRHRVAALNAGLGSGALLRWRSAVEELRAHLNEDASLEETAHQQRLRSFLFAQRIRNWKQERVSAIHRLVLETQGIETAADFDRDILRKTNFLSDEARAALLDWREQLISSYRQRAAGAAGMVSREEINRRRVRRRLLESEVVAAYEAVKQAPRSSVAIPAERIREVQALRAELAKAHARCVEYARDLP